MWQLWPICRHLLWHGLDLLELYLGSVVTQFCLSPSSDPSDPTASMLGLILGITDHFPTRLQCNSLFRDFNSGGGSVKEVVAFGPLLCLLCHWYLLEMLQEDVRSQLKSSL